MLFELGEGNNVARVVRRPAVGHDPAKVTLTASIATGQSAVERKFDLVVQPSVRRATYSRYIIVNFARSNNTEGQQIYVPFCVGKDQTRWVAANNGHAGLSSKGHAWPAQPVYCSLRRG
jgi:hypothetical protein